MGNSAKSCKEAEIRAGLYNIKFEPSLPVLRDVQKRAVRGRGGGAVRGGGRPFPVSNLSLHSTASDKTFLTLTRNII